MDDLRSGNRGTGAGIGNAQCDARPDYLKEFKANYPKLAEQAETTKCNICHYGDKKTNRNDYGKAFAKNFGDMKNVKDAEKIKEVLKKTEKEKSSVEGKTFGDLLEDGKLPGKNP